MKNKKIEYHPKLKKQKNKTKEDERKISKMIDEGGPVNLEEDRKEDKD